MTAAFSVEVLGHGHDRPGFSSGVEALDRYFREQVTHEVRRRAMACYVAVETATARVAGYYTLAAGGVPLAELPEKLAKRLPRYPSVPVARLGRLAVDRATAGKSSGSASLGCRNQGLAVRCRGFRARGRRQSRPSRSLLPSSRLCRFRQPAQVALPSPH